jgi:hypothetical protein
MYPVSDGLVLATASRALPESAPEPRPFIQKTIVVY